MTSSHPFPLPTHTDAPAKKNDIIVMAPQAGGFTGKREGLIWEAHIHDNRW